MFVEYVPPQYNTITPAMWTQWLEDYYYGDYGDGADDDEKDMDVTDDINNNDDNLLDK